MYSMLIPPSEFPIIERADFQQRQDVISNRAKRVIWLHAVYDGVIANFSDNVGHKFRVVHAHSSFGGSGNGIQWVMLLARPKPCQ